MILLDKSFRLRVLREVQRRRDELNSPEFNRWIDREILILENDLALAPASVPGEYKYKE